MRQSPSFLVALLLLACISLPALAEDYCFGFLMTHPERQTIPEAEAMEIQKGHLAHMESMALAGKLLVAGPMATAGAIRGIVIYRCQNLEEAAAFTANDPAVLANRLQPVFQIWRGPSDVGEPLASEVKRNSNAKHTMVTLPFILLRHTAKREPYASLKTMRREQDFLTKLRRKKQLRLEGAFLGQPDHPTASGEPAALLVFTAMPVNDAAGLAKNHPLVKQGLATVEALEWYVAHEAIPLP